MRDNDRAESFKSHSSHFTQNFSLKLTAEQHIFISSKIPALLLEPEEMAGQTLWLRCEKKEFERRAALSPANAKKLVDAGFTIYVERDEQRIFDDAEYEA